MIALTTVQFLFGMPAPVSTLYVHCKDNQSGYPDRSNRYSYSSSQGTEIPSPPNDPRYAPNVLDFGARPESRKGVRFVEKTGCRHIPGVGAYERFAGRISGKLKSFRIGRTSTLVFESTPTEKSPRLLCFPRISRRRSSVSPIETAVWNSGRQLRQFVPSPNLLKRISDFSSCIQRLPCNANFIKWRSQPLLKPPAGYISTKRNLKEDAHFDKMESVYVSDSDIDYELTSSPDEWDGYENFFNVLPRRPRLSSVCTYETIDFGGPKAVYESVEDALLTYDIPQERSSPEIRPCESPKQTDERVNHAPINALRTSGNTMLQERVAKSLKQLSIPNWMRNKPDEDVKSVEQRKYRLPRFPRYIDSLLVSSSAEFCQSRYIAEKTLIHFYSDENGHFAQGEH